MDVRVDPSAASNTSSEFTLIRRSVREDEPHSGQKNSSGPAREKVTSFPTTMVDRAYVSNRRQHDLANEVANV